MVEMHPRDQRDWMRHMERRVSEANRAGSKLAIVAAKNALDDFKGEYPANVLTKTPTNPVELTYDSSIYRDSTGGLRARLIVDFPDVVKATDGTDIVVDSYELAGRTEGTANWYSTFPATNTVGLSFPGTPGSAVVEQPGPFVTMGTSPSSNFRLLDLPAGDTLRFKVRASGGRGLNAGQWSVEVVAPLETDTLPPAQPTAPTAVATRGVIVIEHDGQSVNGPLQADLKYLELAVGETSSPTNVVREFGRQGTIYAVTGADYYTPQFARVRAVDESGNYGPWSEQAVAYTQPLVDTDVILSVIDGAKTYLKNIDAGVSILENTVIAEHLVATESLTAKFAQFLKVDVGMLNVNEMWADEAFFGVADAKLVRSDMFEGKLFRGGRFVGTTFKTNEQEYEGIDITSGGIIAYKPTGGLPGFQIDAASGDVNIYGGTLTAATVQTTLQNSRGLKIDETGVKAWDPNGIMAFSVSAATGRGVFSGRVSTAVGPMSGSTLLPALDAENKATSGVFISYNSSLVGGVTAGMWVDDTTVETIQEMYLRGWYGGGVLVVGRQLRVVDNVSGIGDFISYAIKPQGLESYIADLKVARSLTIAGHPTTSASANAIISTSPTYGQVFRSTSSIDYKSDVQDVDHQKDALKLRPRTWVDKNPIDPSNPFVRYCGYIAHEVRDAGLEMFVTYDEWDEPESVMYDRMPSPLVVPVLKAHEESINELLAWKALMEQQAQAGGI